MNIARIIYDSYPCARELLPEEVADDLEKMYRYVIDTDPAEFGESLLRFVVIEAYEGGQRLEDGQIDDNLVYKALSRGVRDLQEVLYAIRVEWPAARKE